MTGDNKLVSEEKNLTLVDSFGDLLDDNIEVDEVQVESCTLVDEACSYLVIIDRLSCAIPLDDILDCRCCFSIGRSSRILGTFHVGLKKLVFKKFK